MQQILTKKGAAAHIGVSQNTFHLLLKEGKIGFVKLTARRIGIMQSDIDVYLAANHVGATK